MGPPFLGGVMAEPGKPRPLYAVYTPLAGETTILPHGVGMQTNLRKSNQAREDLASYATAARRGRKR